MQDTLFREQAIEHHKNRLHGEVLVLPSIPHVLVGVLLSIWVLAAIAWLVTSHYARQESVSGWLEPPTGVVKVFAENANGKIKQILVEDGTQVTEGQTLLIINGDRTLTSGNTLESTLAEEYVRQQRFLSEQLTASDSIHRMRSDDIQQQIRAVEADIERIAQQIETLDKRNQLIDSRVANYRAMTSNGNIASIELDKLLEQQLSLQSEQQSLQREIINGTNQLQQLTTQLAILPQEHQNHVNGLNAKISDLAQKRAQLNGQRAYVIKASRDGIVSNLQAQVGQQTSINKPLLSLVPQGIDIEAKLLVPVRAVGFVKPGQSIEVRYDAFPFQKFGLYKGVVTRVSDSIVLPNELQAAPFSISEPVYLVQAVLESNKVNAYGKELGLKSGMTLSADIQLNERSMLEWLFEPLISLRGRM